MMRKVLFILLVSLPVYFFVVKFVTDALHRRELVKEEKQTKIILENVQERFRLFLELPHSVGTMGADYFAQGELEHMDYAPFRRMLEAHPEIYGLSVLNETGKIVRSWPYKENEAALGKTTQNIEHIRLSYSRGKDYWLSAPFNLYQGERGFVFYMPIIRADKLRGWFAPVVNTETFSSKFRLQELLSSYELIIQDVATSYYYFTTAMAPEKIKVLQESTLTLYGREIRFLCWRKLSLLPTPMGKLTLLGMALLLSLLTLFIFGLYEQKKKVRHQLRDISTLLKMTYQEAQTKLIGLHGELVASKTEAIDYLNNLIEQIDLLQTMTLDEDAANDEVVPLMPLLENQLRFFNESIENKKLKVLWSDHSPHALSVKANGGLLQNALNIIFAHAMILARPQSEVQLELSLSRDQKTALVALSVPSDLKGPPEDGMERRIEVARRALQINQGQLNLQGMEGGLRIHIHLPLAKV